MKQNANEQKGTKSNLSPLATILFNLFFKLKKSVKIDFIFYIILFIIESVQIFIYILGMRTKSYDCVERRNLLYILHNIVI